MQLVRLSGLVGRERTLGRKVAEIFYALRMERTFAKERILEEYVNRVPLGRGLVGLVPACMSYFGKRPSELSFSEAALLVSILPAPSVLDPRRNLDGACIARNNLLRRLKAQPEFTEQATAALLTPCSIFPGASEQLAPHALQMLKSQKLSGLVSTTLDLGTQATIEAAAMGAAERLSTSAVKQLAIVVLDSESAEVRALVGSVDSLEPKEGQINGANLPRQAGSALKPFLYVEALNNGFTLDTSTDDVPSVFNEGNRFFTPQNADGLFRGTMTLREALAQSRNVPAVSLVQAVGPARFVAVLSEFGLRPLLHSPDWYGLGIGLGTPEVRLLELTGAYATLGRNCRRLNPTFTPLEQVPMAVAEGNHCQEVIDALRDEDARVRGFGRASRLGFDSAVAVKTGTSSGPRDMWFFAVEKHVTVGIWAGNFDMTPATEDSSSMSILAPVAQGILRDLGVR
jgi:penicillin-binding protein 1C